ncbi:MAG: class I SAM-dependent methyltransferase [Chloroflexi bacterium]|nr:class I SAM-dependent methyltransferase [Chloroflexota bacterium]
MSTDSPEFWDETWGEVGAIGSGSDDLLGEQIGHLNPGRALEIGCGLGGNAVWLAKNGWQVTAVDYSAVAIAKGKQLAAEQDVSVNFVVADASIYEPKGSFDLIICFYIQLFPKERASMLTKVSEALAPGGTFLFVSHDASGSPSGWSEEDLLSLTTPQEIVRELPDLQIEHASVLEDEEGEHATKETCGSQGSRTTLVRAVRPK